MKQTAILFAAVGGVLYTLPASAADDGLPQFNTALFPEQLFWLVLSFGLLYLMMRFFALPGVERVQDKRQQVIDSALTAAKTANEQAKAMGHESDKALAEARAKANATISAIKTEASKLATEQQTAQSKQLNERLREAEANIATTRDVALRDVEGTVAGLAAMIVENVTGTKVKA